jgi:hypothetical protein
MRRSGAFSAAPAGAITTFLTARLSPALFTVEDNRSDVSPEKVVELPFGHAARCPLTLGYENVRPLRGGCQSAQPIPSRSRWTSLARLNGFAAHNQTEGLQWARCA